MKQNPFRKGTCIKILTRTPKKPNSALRKIAKVKLPTGVFLFAFIPGETHNLQVHSSVLIRGRPARNVPGVSYRMVRGVFDLKGLDRKKNDQNMGVKRTRGDFFSRGRSLKESFYPKFLIKKFLQWPLKRGCKVVVLKRLISLNSELVYTFPSCRRLDLLFACLIYSGLFRFRSTSLIFIRRRSDKTVKKRYTLGCLIII